MSYRKGIPIPYIDEKKCTNCNLCTKVCPGSGVDFIELNERIFGKQPTNLTLGNYIRCYLGHAVSVRIRYGAASGGVITAILSFLLEKGLIDGALVVRMRKFPNPEPYIAKDVKSLLMSRGSIYVPVPLNMAIKQIIKNEGRYAVVGLPCHIQGLRKAEQLIRTLKERVVVHIGLFCGGSINLIGTLFALRNLGVNIDDIENIRYRGKGWPGYSTISLKNGKKIEVPFIRFWSLSYPFFVPLRCMLCPDGTNELADISCGDAWLPRVLKYERIGASVIVTRSEIGEEIVNQAMKNCYIKVEEISPSDIIKSQGTGLIQRKIDNMSRLTLVRTLGLPIPKYRHACYQISFLSYMRAILLYLKLMMGRYRLYKLIDLYNVLNKVYFHQKYYYPSD